MVGERGISRKVRHDIESKGARVETSTVGLRKYNTLRDTTGCTMSWFMSEESDKGIRVLLNRVRIVMLTSVKECV